MPRVGGSTLCSVGLGRRSILAAKFRKDFLQLNKQSYSKEGFSAFILFHIAFFSICDSFENIPSHLKILRLQQ